MFRRLAAALCLVAITGCAGAGFNNRAFQSDYVEGRYDTALEKLKAFSDKDVSALLDQGLVLQAKGNYEESNAAFESAERLIEDLYTRSISKEVLALLASDLALDYRASGFEHAYISYFRAWNYMELGMPDEVLVEARRINERLTFRSASCEDAGGKCGHDVFLRYFSGLVFEWGGELNDAYIAYKQADIAAATARELYGTQAPRDLGVRLVRLARRLGFSDQAAEYAEAYGLDAGALPRGSSTVVVFWENGLIGTREQETALIPIFKGERESIRQDQDGWSHRLAKRRHMSYDKVKLDYLLRVSLPVFVENPPVAAHAEMHLGKQTEETQTVAMLSAMAARALDQAMGGILARAIGRGLAKYLAKEAADDKVGEGAGVLVNLLGVLLENADTRSWRSLPNQIQMATIAVSPGKYEGRLEIYGASGKNVIEQAEYATVEVPEDSIVFLRHRTP